MRNIRLISRLDVKMDWLIKGVQMEGWRKVGKPEDFAKMYAHEGADELLFMDVVASLYDRNNLQDVIRKVASSVFIPMTVGGGIRSTEDVREILACGADKVAINTAATRDPELINEIASLFGSQATVVSIEAINQGNQWLAMTDNGRNHTGLNVIDWAKQAESRGAGEIILTSIDRDGLGNGLDIKLIKSVADAVNIPVVCGGGFGDKSHLSEAIDNTQVSAVSIAQALHWKKLTISELREVLIKKNCFVRKI